MNEERNKFIRFLIFQVIFWGLELVLFNYWQYSGGLIICSLYIIWYFLEKDIYYKFYVLISGLPFQAMTKISAGTPSIAVLLYACFILECLSKKSFRISRRLGVSIISIAILQLIAALRYNQQISNVISISLMIIFSAITCDLFDSNTNPVTTYERCAWIYSLSLVIDIYIVNVFPQLPYYILRDKQLILDRVGRFCALNGDPNYFGQLIIVGVGFMSALSIRYIKNKEYKTFTISTILSIVLAINGMRSISKAYVFALAGVVMILLWYISMEGKTVGKKILSLFLLICVGSFALYFLLNKLILPTISMRSDVDLFTGRLEKWDMYLNILRDDPFIILFGTGFANSVNVLRSLTGSGAATHNLYLELICDVGIVGLFFVSLPLFYKKGIIYSLFDNSLMLFVWGFLITSIGLSASASDVMYYIIPLMTLVICYSRKQKEEIENSMSVDER